MARPDYNQLSLCRMAVLELANRRDILDAADQSFYLIIITVLSLCSTYVIESGNKHIISVEAECNLHQPLPRKQTSKIKKYIFKKTNADKEPQHK